MKKDKNILIILLVVFISIVIIYNIPKLFINKVTELPEVKLKNNIEKRKSLAIMVSNDGSDYYEYESDTWPNENYKYKNAKCIDNNGNLVENIVTFNDKNHTVQLKTDKTVYCTLYFDKSLITYLRSKDTNNNLTENLISGLYRYQANSIVTSVDLEKTTAESIDTLNNNYICLGENCTQDSNDMYRIIGITDDGLLKVIKNTPYKSLQWYSDSTTEVYWNQSLAYQDLNEKFILNLPEDLQNKIVDTTWKYGNVNESGFDTSVRQKINEYNSIIRNKDKSFEERKTAAKEYSKFFSNSLAQLEEKVSTNEVSGKIGLMNIIDYHNSFESNGEVFMRSSRTIIDSVADGFWSQSEAELELFGISWLTPRFSGIEMTMTYISYIDWSQKYMYYIAGFYLGSQYIDSKIPARPVFFLSPDIELTGNGTIDSPFNINIKGTYNATY